MFRVEAFYSFCLYCRVAVLVVCLFICYNEIFFNILTYFMQTCKVVSYIFPNIEALFEVPISVR